MNFLLVGGWNVTDWSIRIYKFSDIIGKVGQKENLQIIKKQIVKVDSVELFACWWVGLDWPESGRAEQPGQTGEPSDAFEFKLIWKILLV